jgi:rod shape-determining protein MreB and related proteins
MLAKYFKQYLYVQLSPQLLTVRDPVRKEVKSEVPEIAIRTLPGKSASIAAVGTAARSACSDGNTQVHNPFAHPRSLVSDFTVAEVLLKAFIKQVFKSSIFSPSPVVVMHPLGEHEGGLTQIELRAMRELALGAGASKVFIWQGPNLTDEQVMHERFPTSGELT